MSYGPVTMHAQHWLIAHATLQRLHAWDWRRNMGEGARPFEPAEREAFDRAVAENGTAIVIAQTMVRIHPAANDAGGAACGG